MKEELVFKRVKKLRKKFLKVEIDAMFVSSYENIFYLSSFVGAKYERQGFLLLTKRKIFLFTDSRQIGLAKKCPSFIEVIELTAANPLLKFLKKELGRKKIKRLGVESHDLTYQELTGIRSKLRGVAKIVPLNGLVEQLRSIKSEPELQAIKKAVKIADQGFDFLRSFIKPGLSEKSIALGLEFFLRKNGAEDISFDIIVAAGKNSSIPHYRPGNVRIKSRDLVLVDWGCVVNGYKSDITRVFFIGKPEEKSEEFYFKIRKKTTPLSGVDEFYNNFFRRRRKRKREPRAMPVGIYKLVFSTQKKVLGSIKAGMTGEEADKIARDYLGKFSSSFTHALGHGVGLGAHEFPRLSVKSKDTLEEGMVFSIEPGIYIPNWGGVRIEDLVVLEKNGCKVLSQAPKDLKSVIIL